MVFDNDIKVNEGRSEVLIFLGKYFPNEHTALKEALRKLQVEVIRESSSGSNTPR